MKKVHTILLAASIAVMSPNGAMAANDAATSAPAAQPRVIVFQQLGQPTPQGLRLVESITAQINREFSMDIAIMLDLSRRASEARLAADRNKTDKAAADNAARLSRDSQAKEQQIMPLIERRQQVLMAPLIQRIEASVAEFAASQGGAPVHLVSDQQLVGQPQGSFQDVTAAFVTWMNARP